MDEIRHGNGETTIPQQLFGLAGEESVCRKHPALIRGSTRATTTPACNGAPEDLVPTPGRPRGC